jgi:HrpA-like RNA helicase
MKRLRAIGAISKDSITSIGKKISSFPVSPRLAVALIKAIEREREDLIIALCAVVSILSVDCTIDTPPELIKGRDILIRNYDDDVHMMLSWFKEWLNIEVDDRENFCKDRSLSVKGMGEVTCLYNQLVGTCLTLRDGGIDAFKTLNFADSKLLHAVRECCIHGFVDQIAHRDEAGSSAYRAPGNSDEVFIHRSSALFRRRPQWIAFFEMVQASGEFSDKRSMRTCFIVDPEYLAEYVESPLIDRTKQHPLMKTRIIGQKKYGYVIPRYLPLSLTIRDCLAVQLD